MKKKIKVLSTQWPPKTQKEWEELELDINEILYGAIARNFLKNALEFKKKLDTSVEQLHGGGNGRRLLLTLQSEFKKVLEVLE